MTHAERAKRRRDVVDAVRNGSTIRDVAEQYQICTGYVYKLCMIEGVALPLPVRPPRPEPRCIRKIKKATPLGMNAYRVVAELINTEDSLREIGRNLEISPQRVCQIATRARQAGIPFATREKQAGT